MFVPCPTPRQSGTSRRRRVRRGELMNSVLFAVIIGIMALASMVIIQKILDNPNT